MRTPVEYACGQCGGAAVTRDAWAEWRVADQSWALSEVFDFYFCINAIARRLRSSGRQGRRAGAEAWPPRGPQPKPRKGHCGQSLPIRAQTAFRVSPFRSSSPIAGSASITAPGVASRQRRAAGVSLNATSARSSSIESRVA